MAASADSSSPAAVAVPADNDKVNPIDFQGSVHTDDKLPSKELIKSIADLPVLDREGKTHPFKSLYEGFAGRTVVIFIRHFFCGVCIYLEKYAFCTSPSFFLFFSLFSFHSKK